ncbi:MAG: magnesium transporter [Anaerolineae bacterium]
MLYFSQMQNRRIWDSFGRPVGRCKDLLFGEVARAFPLALALVISDGQQIPSHIPMDQVSSLYPSITLNVPRERVRAYHREGNEIQVAERVLDRQIVDTQGRRVVRVNDVQLARIRDEYRLTGVDIGGRGLLRRLGLEGAVEAAAKALGKPLPEGVLPWEDVAPISKEDPLRLRISRDKISRLPPADIAAILSELDRPTGEALLSGLRDETLADALEESPADVQMAVLLHMNPERAADILEEMDPDEATDILADMPEVAIAQLLELMEDEDAADVSTLLTYPEDSAGGIMTTEFARVPKGFTATGALTYLQRSEEAQEDETMHYVYVVDGEGRLEHMMKLRDLVMADPDAAVEEVAERVDPHITVTPHTPQQDVAYLVAKYDLLAVPVVDEETQMMLGIVTVDDAIDAVLPTAWKKRLPRFS